MVYYSFMRFIMFNVPQAAIAVLPNWIEAPPPRLGYCCHLDLASKKNWRMSPRLRYKSFHTAQALTFGIRTKIFLKFKTTLKEQNKKRCKNNWTKINMRHGCGTLVYLV